MFSCRSGPQSWVVVLATLVILIPAAVGAHGHRHSHGAHVHGEAHVQLILEAGTLSIDVRAPGASVVGFERRARDAAEMRHVEAALAYFRKPDSWLVPSTAAGCRLERPTVDGSPFEPGGTSGEGHADVTAAYRYSCARPAELAEVHLRLFERFPALERVRLEYIVHDAQGEALLTPRAPVARLRP